MHRSNITRSQSNTVSVGWRVIIEQLDLVAVTLKNRDRNFSAGHAGDFTCQCTRVMRPMRQLETEGTLPEGQRSLEVRNGDTSVIRCDDAE